MFDLRELYQEIILDHSRRPRNFARPEDSNHEAHGDNPLCGDRISVYLSVADGVVTDVGFDGRGCAISLASASMMTEAIKGKTVEEARALFERFHNLITGDNPEPVEEDSDLNKLNALAGVREYPIRVKCATLPWHTLTAAMDGAKDKVSTE